MHRHHVVTLADLADELAVKEHGMTIDGIPADAVTEIYLSLYHCHVPKLVDANIVEYDQDQDLVSITADGTAAHGWFEEEIFDFSERPSPSRLTCTDER
ncbi:DNA-binding protein [Natronococcus pandeyae]|uniref:DNA-binding protein n=1 Tax=Natronococcus pandeyae TaxID=2055836 RepID=A0A8J8TPA4_9EURY|nr:DNA-binding protein [Natronococcus pandeyae]